MTLNSRPTPSSRYNLCPVCEGTNGACRTLADDTVFCHRLADAVMGEFANGYICVKPANGHTATFKPDNTAEWTQERRREWEAQKVARQQKAGEEERSQRERALSNDERHQIYSKIFDQLSYDSVTLADLRKRGFSDEDVIKSGFKSISRFQPLIEKVTTRLPGIAQDGKSLAIANDGYLCPIKDWDGKIVGAQLRLHNSASGESNKYRWLSTPSTATLHLQPENELPLAVFHPPSKPEGIALVEGVGAKPFLTSQRFNWLVIGASGGQFCGSKKQLERYLTQAHELVGGEKVLKIALDAGDIKNPGVVSRWQQVNDLVVSLGWRVNFLWWGQVHKGDFCDIDELQPEQFDWIRYLSVAEFEALCIKWGGLEAKKPSKATPIDYAERVAIAQKRLHTLSYPSDLVCDASKKYLPDLVGLVPTRGKVAIKAQKGSGKSHQIKKIKDHCCGYWEEKDAVPEVDTSPVQLELLPQKSKNQPEVKAEEPKKIRVFHKGLGMKFLSINARIALGREQAIRWEFTWIEDADLEAKEEFEGAKLSSVSLIENIGEIGLCWDSLGKIFNRDWADTLVVIDETELGLNHVSTSSTCRDRRSFILHTLEHKLKECLDNRGLVITADADLTDSSLDYLDAVAPGHPPFIVTHDFRGEPWDVVFRTGKRDTTLSEIDEWLSDENCRPIVVATDNQKEAEALSLMFTKKYPWLAKEKGGLIRVDSKVTQTDYGKDFVKHINECIVKYQPKVLIYTPSLGVGCSIDNPYFAHVFGLFFGNVEPSQARQALARPRQPIPRTVWAKEKVSNTENEPTSYLPEEIKRRMFDTHDGTMTLVMDALTKARQLAIDTGIEQPEDKDILPVLIETLQGMMGADGSWNNPHLDLYCNQVARRNFSLSQYAIQLRQELIDEGHNVIDDCADSSNSMGDAVKQGKAEIREMNAIATAKAEFITFEEAQELKHKPVRTEQEEHQIQKAFLQQDLPGVELTPEFVHKAKYKDDGRWLAKVKLHWYLENPEALKDRDDKEWRYKLKQFSKGVAFLPDVKTYTPKVEAILKSGVLDWIKPGDLEAEYSNESEEGKAFVKRCYSNRKIIKAALNITVQRDSEPVKLANKILDRIGLALTYSKRGMSLPCGKKIKTGDDNRIRYYKLDKELATDSDRKIVWEALNQRQRERFSKTLETIAQKEQNHVQNDLKSLDKNNQCGRENKPGNIPLATVLQKVTFSQKEPINENAPSDTTPPPSEEISPRHEAASGGLQPGDLVTHSDSFHVRGGQRGRVEDFNDLGEVVVFWFEDGDNQRHPAHRCYPEKDLRAIRPWRIAPRIA